LSKSRRRPHKPHWHNTLPMPRTSPANRGRLGFAEAVTQ